MSIRRMQILLAAFFFAGWFIVLLMAADYPLPFAFWRSALIVAVGSVVVFLRVPVYASWSRKNTLLYIFRAGFEGVVAGVVVGLLTSNPDTGIQAFPYRYLAGWFAVVMTIGAANAIVIYLLTRMVAKN